MGLDLRRGDHRRRRSDLLATVLIALLVLQAILFAVSKGTTYDEAIDIAAGYAYLRTGNYRLCPEHPALATAITAAPLLLLDLRDPMEDPEFRSETRWRFAIRFLHENRADAATILFLARLPSILLAAVLGWWLYRFAGSAFGPWGGLASLFLYATAPTVIAHSALATADSIVALFIFGSVVLLLRCLTEPTPWRVVAAGAMMGAAFATKMTSLVLVPVGILLAAGSRPVLSPRLVRITAVLPERIRPRAAAALLLLVVFGIGVITLWAPYLWRGTADPSSGPSYLHDLATLRSGGGVADGAVSIFGWSLPDEYRYGIREMIHSARDGWPGYIFGRRFRQAPSWAYPAVLLAKLREAVILGFAAAIILWGRTGWGASHLFRLLCLPVLLIGLLMGGGYHGVRILLPAFPFIFIVIGAAAGRMAEGVRGRRLLGAAGLLAALPTLLVFPDLLAYQNLGAGRRGGDYQRLVDSDLDWGQDLPALARRLREMGKPLVHLRYFGSDDPRRYGFAFRPLRGCDPVRGHVAISATHLQGVYMADPDCHAWLRGLRPVARAGRSILIYDRR